MLRLRPLAPAALVAVQLHSFGAAAEPRVGSGREISEPGKSNPTAQRKKSASLRPGCIQVGGAQQCRRRKPLSPAAASSATPAKKGAKKTESPSVAVSAATIVITGTRTPEQLQNTTLRTGAITREEAERRGASSVAEALQGEPGLQVNPNSYGTLGSPSGVTMQGLDAERVLILQDGERVIGDSGGVVDLARFSLGGLSRIEYVLGPSSSLYGTGALGGVVNMISGPPQEDGLSGRSRVELRQLPEALVETNASYRGSELWTAAFGSLRYSSGVPSGTEGMLALPKRLRSRVGLRLGHEGRRQNSQFGVRYANLNSAGLQIQEVPGLGNFLVDLPGENHHLKFTARQEFQLDGGTALRASANGQAFWGKDSKDLRGSPRAEHRSRRQRMVSVEGTATIPQGPAIWVIGARIESEAFKQRLDKIEVGSSSPSETHVDEVRPTELRVGAVYAQSTWQATSWLSAMVGLRGELHKRFGAVAAPRLALKLTPSERFLIRASGGRGFRAPSTKEYGFLFDHSFLGYRVIGNHELQPETSWGLSGDVTWRPEPRVSVRIGAFQNWISSLITSQYVGQDTPNVDDYSYANVGSATTSGADLSFNLRPSEQLQATLSYNYLLTHNDEANRPLPSRPPHTLLSALTWSPSTEVTVTYRNRLVSAAYVADDLLTPAFLTTDLRLAWRPAPYAELYLAGLNLLGSQEDAQRPGDQRPVVGRQLVVGLIARLPQS